MFNTILFVIFGLVAFWVLAAIFEAIGFTRHRYAARGLVSRRTPHVAIGCAIPIPTCWVGEAKRTTGIRVLKIAHTRKMTSAWSHAITFSNLQD